MSNVSSKGRRHSNRAAPVAVALVVVLISSDFYAGRFWLDHPVTTAILASLTVVLVSVTVIEVILNRRSERRWRLLAQYALLELADAARGAWGVLLGVVDEGNSGSDVMAAPSRVTQVLNSPERAPVLKRKIEAILTHPHKRDELRESLERTLDTSRELISRWGAVLTGSSSFSELFDRHVEMIRTYPRAVVLPGVWDAPGKPVPVSGRQPQRRLVRRQPSVDDPHRDSPRG